MTNEILFLLCESFPLFINIPNVGRCFLSFVSVATFDVSDVFFNDLSLCECFASMIGKILRFFLFCNNFCLAV